MTRPAPPPIASLLAGSLRADGGPAERSVFLSKIKEFRQSSSRIDAQVFLDEHPEVRDHHSLAIDVAYEEFCQRREAGEVFDAESFCQRFPAMQTSLRRLVQAHDFLEANPHLIRDIQVPVWPQPGDAFLGFLLQRELGRGAFARVFLATEPALGGRLVAVKISLYGAAEAETLGRLEHPHIVRIHYVQLDPASGLTAVCMPYLGDATLYDVLDRLASKKKRPQRARIILDVIADRRKPEDRVEVSTSPAPLLVSGTYVDGVCQLGVQLAEALAFIHDRGVFHRDLKPSNVLLGWDGRPMLLDFNLSSDAQTHKGRLGGTLPYMSPEQLQTFTSAKAGEASDVDARSDLFGLGVILYETLAGKHPFGPIPSAAPTGELQTCLLERQRRGPPPLRSFRPEVDPALAQTIESCLAFDRAQRPQTAADLADALRRAISRRRRLRRWVAGHVWVSALAAIVFFLTVAAISSWLTLRPSYAVRQLASAQSAYAQGEYADAIASLNQAIKADPNLTDAYFLRGRCHQRRDDIGPAMDDYKAAAEQAPNGKFWACLGYCASRLFEQGSHATAIQYDDLAIQAGFANAAVYNNRGYSLRRLARQKEAQESLDKAVSLDPTLQAAFLNRVVLAYSRLVSSARSTVPESTWNDLDQAIAVGPASAALYFQAAKLNALAARTDNQRRMQALNYLQQAVKYGQDPVTLKTNQAFQILRADPQFQELTARPSLGLPTNHSVYLADPIQDN